MARSAADTSQPSRRPAVRPPVEPCPVVRRRWPGGRLRSGRLLLPMMRRLIEYRAVITRMPESSGLILNLVCSTPVVAPASMPGEKAPASVADQRDRQCRVGQQDAPTRAAPRVIEPSTVMSAKRKTRNDRNTPSGQQRQDQTDRPGPDQRHGPSQLLFLAAQPQPMGPNQQPPRTNSLSPRPDRLAMVGQQVQDALQRLLLEQGGHGGPQFEFAARQGPVGEGGRVKMALQRRRPCPAAGPAAPAGPDRRGRPRRRPGRWRAV